VTAKPINGSNKPASFVGPPYSQYTTPLENFDDGTESKAGRYLIDFANSAQERIKMYASLHQKFAAITAGKLKFRKLSYCPKFSA